MTTDLPSFPAELARRPVPAAGFCATRWSQVSLAKADSEAGRRALAVLCEAYYGPVAAALRRELRDAEAAQEMTQEFFNQILAGGAIGNADRNQGRFRSYLLGAVKHFLGKQREAAGRLKRGGGMIWVSLDDETHEGRSVLQGKELSPDAAFDRQWALTVLARALEALRGECADEGRLEFFEQMKPWLTGEAAHGEQVALAGEGGRNANVLKVAVHRLKRRFRQLVKAEIASTLDDPEMVEAEMGVLFAALGN